MRNGHGLLLATIAISMFLDGLDGTIVNVALPTIADSFGIGTDDTSWVATVYFLVMAGLILVFGRLCDMGAIKKVLVTGMAVFTAGSLMCGLSGSLAVLLAFRAVQGVGAGMVAASAVMLGVKFLPKERLGLAMTLVVLGSSVGMAIGPTLGALITEYASWHWIFFINVPVGALAIAMASRSVPADGPLERGAVDLAGSAMLFAAIVTGLFAVERVPSEGLTPVNAAAAAACAVLLAAFVLYERGRESPVVDLSIFRHRGFDAATVAYVLVNTVIMGTIYLLPFLLRQAMGMDTLGSGLVLSVQSVSMTACCLVAGKLSGRFTNRQLAVFACLMQALGAVMLALVTAESSLAYVVLALVVMGTVWGTGGGPMGARMVDTLPDGDRGSGSSMMSFVLYFSSALGTALFAGLFALGSGEGSTSISDVPVDAFMDGFALTMAVAAALALVSAAISWGLRSDGGEGQ